MLPINWKDLSIKLLIIIIPVIVLYWVVAEEHTHPSVDYRLVRSREVGGRATLDITQSQLENTQEQLRLMTKRVTELERAYEDIAYGVAVHRQLQTAFGRCSCATALPVDSHFCFRTYVRKGLPELA